MEKILEYNLKINLDEKLPSLPILHDYKIDEIKIENGKLIILSNDVAYHDDDSFAYTGIHAKSVCVEFSLEYKDECDVNMTILHRDSKKKWKKYRKYYGNEFIGIYKDFNLEIINPMVSFCQINFILFGKKKNKRFHIIMEIRCDKVKYTFTD